MAEQLGDQRHRRRIFGRRRDEDDQVIAPDAVAESSMTPTEGASQVATPEPESVAPPVSDPLAHVTQVAEHDEPEAPVAPDPEPALGG